ncbi:MAG: hypothetical protein IPN59_13005 [Holophaga sp.]|nr:hypothetical protein [Holophaga sp.]
MGRTAAGSINQHLLPWLYLALEADALQGNHPAWGMAACFFKAQAGRLVYQSIFWRGDILGQAAMIARYLSKDFISNLKLSDVFADQFHPPGDI